VSRFDALNALPLLVVEDEPSVMSYIRIALERKGYTVCGAKSGADALALLDEYEFAGIISDMRTPGGVDGADVHRWLKLHRPEMADRLIFITGDTVNDETAATLQRTGAPYIEKPFRVHQLIDMVEQTIGAAK
jgi:two-component system NtrC family sensor kinase